MRLTIKNPGYATNYRLPLREDKTMYLLEAEKAEVYKQEGRYVNSYFGVAVDKLGEYENLGSPEEIKEKFDRLDKLERREAG